MTLTTIQKEMRKDIRRETRKTEKMQKKIEVQKNQRPIKKIEMVIEWRKSKMWGYNPTLTANIEYKNGQYECQKFKATGCGYDKKSTVIGQCFNSVLRYKLHKVYSSKKSPKHNKSIKIPYGITFEFYKNFPSFYFGQGVGTECFLYDDGIANYINGKFEKVSSGDSSDAYIYTDLDY